MQNKTQTQAQNSKTNPSALGSVELVIKEVDVSQPSRSVTRMWPNR